MVIEEIFIDGINKTKEIADYEVREDEYLIRYKGSDTIYPFSKEKNRVVIKKKSIGPFMEFAKIADSIKVVDDFSALSKYYENVTIEENSLLHKYLNGTPFETFIDENPLVFPFRFNKSQLNATRKVFKNELSIIQGPPGTGKTQTILNIIANILVRGENVAIVSNNNAAVDNIKDKLIKDGYDFVFALLGSKKNQEDFFKNQVRESSDFHDKELDEENLEKLKSELIKSSNQLEQLMEKDRQKRIITEQLNALRLEKKYYNNAHDIKDLDNRHISFITLGYEKVINFLVDHQIMITESEKLTLKNKFKLLVKYGIYRFKYLQEKDYEVITRFQQIYYDLKIKELEDKLAECQKTLQTQRFDKLADKHYQVSQEILNHYLSQRFKKKEKHTIDSYKKDFDSFIKDYPVILSTAYSVTYSVSKGFMFDYVIIDEASTLDLVKAVLPLSCAKKIVIVGDQKQLPHIPEKIEMSFENEAYDYRTKNIMDSLDCLYGDTIERTLLQEHYRCHPDIIRFCNMKYYDGNLIVYSNCSNNNAISVIKTAAGNHMRELTRGRKGVFNQRELEELSYLIKNESEYRIELYSKNLNDIGLLSPYRLQIEYSKEINSEEIEKDTIHKYQGREKSVIVFSTVLDQSAKSKRKMPFVNNPQMVNVAVSRAENQLILITNTDAFYKNGNDIGDLIKYIEYHDEKNIEEGRVISVFDLLYRDYSERLLARKEAMNNVKKNIRFDSEKIIYSVISELLRKEIFNCYSFAYEVKLSDIFLNQDICTEVEKKFIKQSRSSVDFIIFNKFNANPVLAIEVDGTEFHLNNPEQLERDKKKDGIFKKYSIPILRLATHTAIIEDMIELELSKITENNKSI
ncbi:Superfamily I DNA and/or RNA helicase [Tissierella praeacuta DSM 18095]|uniref:Superfamily I DNA and/or RNA helicase n=1 Tax=Tissierella praeacuta DSM 18095 TaxID=1123404 RepID=A0A1M4X905_9FIRM|nr:AAA domain-containing protein [Tissierella praeacuta]SHE89974.1 Superfamily I DNA and/or RNA helicase [Tissierella praeacuta DSM 18095]SUP02531.1 putative DNA helicase [Tissierella praeacuta]